MKNALIVFAAIVMMAGTVSFGSTEISTSEVAESEANLAGYWHCTAYPEGHGHTWGYSYRDIHYSHARRGAMMRCERATHQHCHHIDCHYDHH